MTLLVPTPGFGRVNRALSPAPANGTSGGWVSTTAGTYGVATFDPVIKRRPDAPGSIRQERQAASLSGAIASIGWVGQLGTTAAHAFSCTAGQTVWAAVWARCELAGRRGRMGMVFLDAAGAVIGTTVTGGWTQMPTAGEWYRLEAALVAPAGAVGFRLAPYTFTADGSNAVVGERSWFCDVTVGEPGDYGDGSMPGWAWSGTPHQSTSAGPGPYYPMSVRLGSKFVEAMYLPRSTTTVQCVRNLHTNPSLHAAGAGQTVVRTNMATDPNATVINTGVANATMMAWTNARWFGGGSATGTHALVTALDGPLPGITTYLRKTWTNAPGATNGDTGLQNSSGYTGFVAGQTYSVSAWLRPSSAKAGAISVQWYDATGQISRTVGAVTLLPAGVWTRVSATLTAPAGATHCAVTTDILTVTFGGVAWAAGDTLDGTGLLVELGGTPGDVVRTNLVPNPAPVRNGGGYTVNFGTGGNGSTTTQASGGPSNAYWRTTVTTANTGGAPYFNVAASEGWFAQVTPGVQHTMSVYVRSSKAIQVKCTATTHNTAAGGGWNGYGGSLVTLTPNTWTRLNVTFTPATGFQWARVIAETASGTLLAVGDTFDVADALLETGTALNGYFNGSTNFPGQEFSWAGTAWQSASTVRLAGTPYLGPYFTGTLRPAVRTNLVHYDGSNGYGGGRYLGFKNDRYGGASGTYSTPTVFGPSGGTVPVVRYTMADTGINGRGFHLALNPEVATLGLNATQPVAPGEVLSFAMQMRVNIAAGLAGARATIRVRFAYRDAWLTGTGVDVTGPATVFAANDQWALVKFENIVVPAGADGLGAYVQVSGTPSGTAAPGDYIEACDFIVEKAPTIAGHFNGYLGAPYGLASDWYGTPGQSPSYLYDPDLTPSWVGSNNASTSRLRGYEVPGAVGHARTAVISSSRWNAGEGERSARAIPTTTNGDTYVVVAGVGSGTAAGAVTLEPGKTYTLMAKLRLDQPLAGAGHPNGARQLAWIVSGVGEVIRSTQAPNVAGVTEHKIVFTVPAGTTYAQARLYHGHALGAGDAWWKDVMIVEGDYSGRYFDGNDPMAMWEGTPNGSTSLGHASTALNSARVR